MKLYPHLAQGTAVYYYHPELFKIFMGTVQDYRLAPMSICYIVPVGLFKCHIDFHYAQWMDRQYVSNSVFEVYETYMVPVRDMVGDLVDL